MKVSPKPDTAIPSRVFFHSGMEKTGGIVRKLVKARCLRLFFASGHGTATQCTAPLFLLSLSVSAHSAPQPKPTRSRWPPKSATDIQRAGANSIRRRYFKNLRHRTRVCARPTHKLDRHLDPDLDQPEIYFHRPRRQPDQRGVLSRKMGEVRGGKLGPKRLLKTLSDPLTPFQQ